MSRKERWKRCVGYEGSYEVSDQGRVRSVDRVVTGPWGFPKRLKGQIISPAPSRIGHLGVSLSKEGVGRSIWVHQLVMTTWVGPCPPGQQVRHGPKGVSDNSISNLCYGTPSEDGLDKRRDGTHKGKAVRRSDGKEFVSQAIAAEETGCGFRCISAVCKGRQKTAGGFGWSYVQPEQ